MKKRFNRIVLHAFIGVILLGVGFTIGQYYLRGVYERQIEQSYRRALSEFATHFQELSLEVNKARVAVSEKQKGLIGSRLRRLIYAAQSNLGELPLGELQLERISHLLGETYEQSYAYVKGDIDQLELENMHKQYDYINHELQELLINKQREFPWVSWHEYLSAKVFIPGVMQSLVLIDNEVEDFKVPKKSGEIIGETITKEQALEIARNFSELQDLVFQVTNESKGVVPTFTVEAKDEEQRVLVEISQKGGMVLWMVSTLDVTESRLSLNEMTEKAVRFLQNKGFPVLHLTDVQVLQNRSTLTFVPERAGILRYGESIKLQVSAFDGRILGFWGTPYHVAQSRSLLMEEDIEDVNWDVHERIHQGAIVLDQRLATILDEQNEEILVTRLGIKYGEEYYLVYLNTQNGEEEKIVRVNSPEFFNLAFEF